MNQCHLIISIITYIIPKIFQHIGKKVKWLGTALHGRIHSSGTQNLKKETKGNRMRNRRTYNMQFDLTNKRNYDAKPYRNKKIISTKIKALTKYKESPLDLIFGRPWNLNGPNRLKYPSKSVNLYSIKKL
jgi:hypothetical protein